MQFIKLDFSNAIASIKLQHAGGNRINFQMREEIFNAVESVAKSDARVLVIKGDGEDFCLGGDVRDWPDVPVDKLRPRVEVFANALDRLEQLDIPTIASVQGGCAGGGFELALACDMIIASRSARFSFPEALIGIMTLQGGVYNIAERIGRTKAIELAFLSDPAPAEQLAQWNVVNRIVDDEALITETDGLAQRLATGPAMVYAATKELLRIWQSEGVPGARKALYDISMPLFRTDDTQRALHNEAQLDGEREAAVARIRELENQVDAITEAASAQVIELQTRADAEKMALVARIRELENQVDAITAATSAPVKELQTAAGAESSAAIDRIRELEMIIESERNAVLSSTSWRITAPLRWVIDQLRRVKSR